MKTEAQLRQAFERYIIDRQRAKGLGRYLSDSEFVERGSDGRYRKFESEWEVWQHCHRILTSGYHRLNPRHP